ncbi:MAG: redoxin domain-containing protein [Balneolaceae bacterium]|nr:redoxin domain-containing protein [Balneolaceae bacterium]
MTATLSVILLCTAFAGAQSLKIKDKAPLTDEKVVDISGKSLTLNEVAESNGLLVIFSCNTCPWVAKWEDRYNGLFQHARENSIGMIALNPNERIRNKGESMEDMKRRADKKEYDFFYALDENHRLADAFGANRTPEVFLFDDELTLVYHGAIDDNANDAADVEQTYVINAIDEMVSGNSVSTAVTKSLGCTIKRIK